MKGYLREEIYRTTRIVQGSMTYCSIRRRRCRTETNFMLTFVYLIDDILLSKKKQIERSRLFREQNELRSLLYLHLQSVALDSNVC